ncbi:MAG: hypothetical protein P8103_18200 [Candidatus Thiodiazotropha sp.]
MRRPSSRQRRLVILSLAVIAFGLAYYAGSRYKDRSLLPPTISGVAIHPPTPLPELPESADTLLKPEALSGHWSLLMLDPHAGETRSPALVRLLQVHNRLASEPDLQRKLVYLYLAPSLQGETQQAIERLGDNLHALTGDADQVAEIFRRFGVEPDSETAALYLIGPQVRLHALFTPDQDTATITVDLTTLITLEP